MNNKLDKIVSLCKRRGFIFPSSEIYGGIGGVYDWGPLGAELKNNIKKLWWQEMVWQDESIVGLDSAILMNPKVWEASGHVAEFVDPLIECKKCHKRYRRDEIDDACPDCGAGEFTEPRQFNLLMKTYVGVVEDVKAPTYLRGETCQGIYVNFLNILASMRLKLPFGAAQIGKAFRNEITPGNFVFRTREFEQMEMQYFVKPDSAEEWYKKWQERRLKWYRDLGIDSKNIHVREIAEKERPHYARQASDVEYQMPWGWAEIEGIHNRGDWDLSRHEKFSGKDLKYFDDESKEKYHPYIVETSAGADRSALTFLVDAYEGVSGGRKESSGDESAGREEAVLHLHPKLSPVKAAVLPLVSKDKLPEIAMSIYKDLKNQFLVQYDEVGSIGRRYRRQDEVGTPWCITVDFESIEKNDVTVRDRDTMKQERIKIEELKDYLKGKLE